MTRYPLLPACRVCFALLASLFLAASLSAEENSLADSKPQAKNLKSQLDAPMLFVKRHAYMAPHIYDDYTTFRPGGGIYVLENPVDPPEKHRIRPVIDPTTKETLGLGVYRDAELSWDAKRVLFAFKGKKDGHTSIYEIGIDGTGLRRLSDPGCDCQQPPQENRYGKGHHDITPCYLPDGRIVFTSTRAMALVPCFNSGVDTLHIMDSDGENVRPLSVNNVTEFDPAILDDGRILYGRWEYVDKTALYMQSLWTMLPDGRMEEALFANNLAKPTAVLDARPVPGTNLIVAAFTPHNGQAVGAICMIDMRGGKNDLDAVTNFTPEYPTKMDQGLRRGPSDPWPINKDVVLITDNAKGPGAIQIIDRAGNREVVYSDPTIDCYSPMLVKPRRKPTTVAEHVETDKPGRFLVTDIYRGLTGVQRGEIKRLRIVEETARVSALPPGGRWWNQAFLISWQGAYSVKNVLGTVPVHEDGSAFFEVPPGRAVYFEVLDEKNREIQRMRTFVQAAPGSTRACVGCHEDKKTTTAAAGLPMAMLDEPAKIQPESWGSGFIDYPTMIQPILDKHCVRCHGGKEGFGKGLDFSGGWTWAFNISYETMIKHRMVGYLNCNNSSVHTSEILPPRTVGSGAAPMAEVLIKRHPELSAAELDLMLAWMDTNSNYFGTWDYTQHATCDAIRSMRKPLAAAMEKAGCVECHAKGHIGNDWVNLQTPEFSRVLRAPMAKKKDGLGVAFCRKRKAKTGYRLVDQGVQPPDVRIEGIKLEWDTSGEKHIVFESTDNEHYKAMLEIIRKTRAEALASPRVDMPGAEIIAGQCRMIIPPPVPEGGPALSADIRPDSAVELSWPRTAETIGLMYQLHRGKKADFTPNAGTQLAMTTGGRFTDLLAPAGKQYYALLVASETERSRPTIIEVDVPRPPPAPAATKNISTEELQGQVVLRWKPPEGTGLKFDVSRAEKGTDRFVRLNVEPLRMPEYSDVDLEPGKTYTYTVTSIDRRGRRSDESNRVHAKPLPEVQKPIFAVDFSGEKAPVAKLLDGSTVEGKLHRGAKLADGILELGSTGHATFDHREEFDISTGISVECWAWVEKETAMPVVAVCGSYNGTGWFIQRYRDGWRWHIGRVSCDGGSPAVGRWVHLVGTFKGRRAALYQDGKLVSAVDCEPNLTVGSGPLIIGNLSAGSVGCQLQGRVKDFKIYRRALRPAEIVEHGSR